LLPGLLFVSLIWGNETPKREMRAVWISTAWKVDFPLYGYTLGQQNEIKSSLNALKAAGFNTVVFQVRPGCDAFYDSNYEPWTHYLTGTYGAPPSPYYDPLQYFIEQAHTRGMELHAWFNPYRLTTGSLSSVTADHVYREHPEWKLDHSDNTVLILNPGIPEVRDYIVDVFMDVVNRYDVDGIHMDDYFYPYEGMASEDAAQFSADPRGFTNIADWRRDNINRFMEALYDSIQTRKPWVKLGVSPFGIWKNGVPYGIIGKSSYDELYCDPIAWLDDGTIDYLAPQLYWPIGGAQDYSTLMPWWAAQIASRDRHLYTGNASYRIADWHDWPTSELMDQVRLSRATTGSLGNLFFRLRYGVLDNPKGFLDSLKADLYLNKALPPVMPWKDNMAPNSPSGLAWVTDAGQNLSWSASSQAADGDTAFQYVIYRSETSPVNPDLSANILDIIPGSQRSYHDPDEGSYYYAISALDRLKNESPVVQGVVSVDEMVTLLEAFQLYPNYPNPFNPATTLSFSVNQTQVVRLSVFNIKGTRVRDIYSGYINSGRHSFSFDAQNPDGTGLATGVYLLRLETEQGSQVRRMLFLK